MLQLGPVKYNDFDAYNVLTIGGYAFKNANLKTPLSNVG